MVVPCPHWWSTYYERDRVRFPLSSASPVCGLLHHHERQRLIGDDRPQAAIFQLQGLQALQVIYA